MTNVAGNIIYEHNVCTVLLINLSSLRKIGTWTMKYAMKLVVFFSF